MTTPNPSPAPQPAAAPAQQPATPAVGTSSSSRFTVEGYDTPIIMRVPGWEGQITVRPAGAPVITPAPAAPPPPPTTPAAQGTRENESLNYKAWFFILALLLIGVLFAFFAIGSPGWIRPTTTTAPQSVITAPAPQAVRPAVPSVTQTTGRECIPGQYVPARGCTRTSPLANGGAVIESHSANGFVVYECGTRGIVYCNRISAAYEPGFFNGRRFHVDTEGKITLAVLN